MSPDDLAPADELRAKLSDALITKPAEEARVREPINSCDREGCKVGAPRKGEVRASSNKPFDCPHTLN